MDWDLLNQKIYRVNTRNRFIQKRVVDLNTSLTMSGAKNIIGSTEILIDGIITPYNDSPIYTKTIDREFIVMAARFFKIVQAIPGEVIFKIYKNDNSLPDNLLFIRTLGVNEQQNEYENILTEYTDALILNDGEELVVYASTEPASAIKVGFEMSIISFRKAGGLK